LPGIARPAALATTADANRRRSWTIRCRGCAPRHPPQQTVAWANVQQLPAPAQRPAVPPTASVTGLTVDKNGVFAGQISGETVAGPGVAPGERKL
jgi:hypothetical protein